MEPNRREFQKQGVFQSFCKRVLHLSLIHISNRSASRRRAIRAGKGKIPDVCCRSRLHCNAQRLRQTHPEINTVSLEENQAAVEAMQSDNPVLSRDIYHKSPEQLYLDKEKLLALYDAMKRSSLRDTAWVRHRFGFDGEPCALAAAARDYGFSISRARRIEDQALRHIRENLAAQGRAKAAA